MAGVVKGARWMRLTEPLLLRSKGHAATAKALRASRIARTPEWYLAISYASSGLFGLAFAASTAALAPIGAAWLRVGVAAIAGMFAFLVLQLGFMAYPRVVAAGRARRIDEQLPSVMTLAYALSRGGMNPIEVLRAVAREREAYGEAAVELDVVLRNVDWLGMDLVAALKDTAASSPSQELRALLDGLVTILNSGAEARDYFKNQAEARLKQAELSLERDLEQTSMLAEMYVSGLLVLPLLLLVVLAGLAPLAPGQDALMPYVVFAMIPLGTAVYLVVLETLLAPENLSVPPPHPEALVDFGMAEARADAMLLPPPWRWSGKGHTAHGAQDEESAADTRSLRWRLFLDSLTQRVANALRRARNRLLTKPSDALAVSGFLALAVAGVGGYALFTRAPDRVALLWGATGLTLLSLSIAFAPVSIFHEIRTRRARRVDAALAPTLTRLAGFNERGISLLQSFQILGNASSGPLAEEMRAVGQDVTWHSSLSGALKRLRARVNTARMTKLSILLDRASSASGNLREVLDIAADDATRTEHLKSTRRQAMASYVVVIYLVFAVFLYVLYVVADLFYGPMGLGAAAAAGAASGQMAPSEAKLLFAQAAVIQGIASGIVAGRLGEGHLASGIKHSIVLGVAAFLIFHFGVL